MTEPPHASAEHPSCSPGAPLDDRREEPPVPGSAQLDGAVAETEAQREVLETVRSISRLEESN